MLEIDELYKSQAATVTIVHPVGSSNNKTGRHVSTHLVESDFSLAISSMFSDSDDGSTGMLQGAMSTAGNLAGAAHRVIKTVQQTVSQWNGTSKPSFDISTTLVNYRKDKSILDEIRKFYAGVSPTFEGPTIKAPYSYSTYFLNGMMDNVAHPIENFKNDELYKNFRAGITGTWALRYSVWFQASRLILTGVSCSFSKEVARGKNEPLYARLSLSFQPAILPSADEIQGWFKTGKFNQDISQEISNSEFPNIMTNSNGR